MKQHIDWLPAVFFLLFGLVFFYAATQIGAEYGGGDGGKILPFAASLCIIVLAARLVYSDFFQQQELSSPADEGIVLGEFLLASGPLLLLVAVYGLFHIWFGYLLATLLCSVLAFRLFGNGWLASLLHSLIGAAILYVLFIKVLRVYDPPGELIDLSGLF